MKKFLKAVVAVTAVAGVAAGVSALLKQKQDKDEEKVYLNLNKQNEEEVQSEEISSDMDIEDTIIQISEVLKNFEDEENLKIRHYFICFNNDRLLKVFKEMKDQGYELIDHEDAISLEKTIENDIDVVTKDIVKMNELISKGQGIYKGYEINVVD